MPSPDRLQLPNLSITGFRGISSLSIPNLSRVTLLAGRNGVGKTTVLEAVQAYASRGRSSVLNEILLGRQEVAVAVDEDSDSMAVGNWASLFHGREPQSASSIVIGPKTKRDQLRLEVGPMEEELSVRLSRFFPNMVGEPFQQLKAVFRRSEQLIPWAFSLEEIDRRGLNRYLDFRRFHLGEDRFVSEAPYIRLGPGVISDQDMATAWDSVALTSDEMYAVEALQLVFPEIERVAPIGEGPRTRRSSGRRMRVKLKGHEQPVPLKSLGDGAVRFLGVALALASNRDGFLLIDESENGIHHSVQEDYWRMILRSAKENNVQVIATTHSWDCITGFARAAVDATEVEGNLVRLERDGDGTYAVEYDEEDLETAASQRIEVR